MPLQSIMDARNEIVESVWVVAFNQEMGCGIPHLLKTKFAMSLVNRWQVSGLFYSFILVKISFVPQKISLSMWWICIQLDRWDANTFVRLIDQLVFHWSEFGPYPRRVIFRGIEEQVLVNLLRRELVFLLELWLVCVDCGWVKNLVICNIVDVLRRLKSFLLSFVSRLRPK